MIDDWWARVTHRGPEQQGAGVSEAGGGRAGGPHPPLRQPVEQQQQQAPGAQRPHSHQRSLPRTRPVPPHLLRSTGTVWQ